METDAPLLSHGAGLVCLLIGAGFIALTGVGLLRLPNMLCRSHAVAKGMTLGMFLMLAAFWFLYDGGGVGWRIGLAILFQALTTPVASHLLTRAALTHEAGDGDEPRPRKRRRRRRSRRT